MSNINNDVQARAAEMAAALRVLLPKEQHRKNQLFSFLYPVIVEMLEQNVTQKAIMATLEEMGLKLHPSRFKELMVSAAKESAGNGNVAEDMA